MKKTFVLFLTVLLSLSLTAQKYVNLKTEKVFNKIEAINDYGLTTNNQVSPLRDGAEVLGSSQNIYGVYLTGPHQVMYNADINTVVFVHRAPASVGGSGEICFDFSTNGGTTAWTNNVWISPGMAAGGAAGRYPSITIYNPENNTDPANARVVANGPALDVNGSGSWGLSFEIDAPINSNPSGINEFYGSNNGDNTDFHPYSLEVGPDGRVWSASIGYASEDYLNFVNVNRGAWDGSKIAWDSPLFTVNPNFNTSGGDKLFFGWSIAVDPTNGDHVYLVVDACLNGDSKNVPTPHAWETTDGGVNWNLVNAVNLTTFETFFENYIIHNDGEPQMPFVVDIDATVDANGHLHVMSEVWSGAPDWGYVYDAFAHLVGGGAIPTRHYCDFMWNGTEWQIMYIYPLQCEPATWGSVKTYMHPQISRTANGEQIVYAWSQTEGDADSMNTAPDYWAYSWYINGTTLDTAVNLTYGTGGQGIMFFPHVSPVVKDNGATLELPIVIPLIDFANGSDMDPPTYYYLYGYEIPDLTPNNVKENVGKPDVLVFPNPVADILYVSSGAKVELTDLTGKILVTIDNEEEVKAIEMKNYPAGIYIVNAYTEDGIVSKKVVNIR